MNSVNDNNPGMGTGGPLPFISDTDDNGTILIEGGQNTTTEEVTDIGTISYDQTDTLGTFNPLPHWVLNFGTGYTANSQNPNLPPPNPDETPPSTTPLNPQDVTDYYDHTALPDAVQGFITTADPPLTQEEIDALNNALTTGIPPTGDLAEDWSTIVDVATRDTQINFNLPSTWTRVSDPTIDPTSWTPVSGTGPDAAEQIFNNMGQTLEDFQEAALKLATSSDGTIDSVVLQDFLKVISKAIQDLKKQLRELQITDAETSEKAQKGKFSELVDRRNRESEMEAKMEEARKKQEKANQTSLAMKIVGPIVAALSTIAGVLLAVCTLGIGTPAAVALIAVGVTIGVAMCAYSIADSVTNCTQKMVEGFNNWIKSEFPVPPNSEVTQAAIKWAIVAAIAIVLIVVIAAAMLTGSGEGAVANAAVQTTTEVVKQAIMSAIKQLAIQMLIMVVMSSNALPELVSAIMKDCGASKEAQKGMEYFVMALEMACIMIAMAKGGGSGGAKNVAQGATETTEAEAQAIGKSISQSIEELGQQLREWVSSLKNIPSQVADELRATIKLCTNRPGLLILFCGLARASPMIASAVGAGIQGSTLLQLSKILEQEGEIQAAEDLLKTLIGLLEKLLNNIQTGMSNREDAISDLTKDFNSIIQAAGQAFSKLSNAILPQQSA